MSKPIPILMYHHVAPDRELTPQGLENQLRYLLDLGFKSLSMDAVAEAVAGKRPQPDQAFAVTFDDGYLDNWTSAFPILQKLKVKATMYVVTEKVEELDRPRPATAGEDTQTSERGTGGFFSWVEARQMIDSGLVEIGSHTHTHRHWNRAQPFGDVDEELRRSKEIIEARLKRPCRHLAWPWGDYENDWWPILEKYGYVSAATTRSGANVVGTPLYELRRLKVSRKDTSWLASRLRWHDSNWKARSFGFVHGIDRRFKSWIQSESPYPHG